MNQKQFVYLGPDKPFGLPITRPMIIKGDPVEIFPELEGYFFTYPAMKQLFVSPSDMALARERLKIEGSSINKAYKEILTANAKKEK